MSQLLNEAEQEVNSARLDTRDNVKDPLDFEHDQAFFKRMRKHYKSNTKI